MLLLLSCLLLEPGKITQTCENAGCAELNPDEPAQPESTNEPDALVDTGSVGTDEDGDGHYAESTDCDDSSPFVYPGAAENDSSTACLEDKDGDGYGAETPLSQHAEAGSDCNDDSSTTFPNAAYNEPGFEEQCMNDRDGDGYLGPRNGGTDCDPNDGLTYPGSTAEEDGVDRDCDRKACTSPPLTSLDSIGDHAAMLILNLAPVCEGVAFLPGYALTMRYCRQNSTLYGNTTDNLTFAILDSVSGGDFELLRFDDPIDIPAMPIFAGEPSPGNLYYVHRSLHDPELQAQLVVEPVTGAIITGNSIFTDNVPEAGAGSGIFNVDENGVSLVALLSGEQNNFLIYERVFPAVDDFISQHDLPTLWPIYCP